MSVLPGQPVFSSTVTESPRTDSTAADLPYWERTEQVRRFADRDPDRRMVALLGEEQRPGQVRVLDLGCAAGRNTVWLAERGFDLYAIDASPAMVEETRRRVGALLGEREALERVRLGPMSDLSLFADASFEVVLAIGILHNAQDRKEWNRAITEIARVTRAGGAVVVSTFSPGSRPADVRLVRDRSDPQVFHGFSAGPLYLVEPETLDLDFASAGFVPKRPTETVRRESDSGYRVAANAIYVRNSLGPSPR